MTLFDPPSPTLPIAVSIGEGAPLSKLDPAVVRSQLEVSGALLLRDYDTDLAGFAELTGALCAGSVHNESPNRDLLDGASGVQSVNKGGDPFPLHPELSREPWRPDVCFFACLRPPEVGGQTNLCDGITIAESMPVAIRDELLGRNLIYVQPASPLALRHWLGTTTPSQAILENPPEACPYRFRTRDKKIFRIFTRPALEPTLFQDALAWGNFLLFARDYLGRRNIPMLEGIGEFPDEWLDEIRRVARQHTYAHKWQRGDVVIVDNSRFMHGRRAIADADERLIATSFGYLKGISARPGEPRDPPWRTGNFMPPDGFEDT